MPWKCLVITLFGWLNRNYVCALLLWGLLLVMTSRYSDKMCRILNLSVLTCKSASQSCSRIHLDCLTAIKSNLFDPQDCLKRCRGGHQGKLIPLLGVPLALASDCLENLLFSLLALVGVYWPQGRMMVQIFGCI